MEPGVRNLKRDRRGRLWAGWPWTYASATRSHSCDRLSLLKVSTPPPSSPTARAVRTKPALNAIAKAGPNPFEHHFSPDRTSLPDACDHAKGARSQAFSRLAAVAAFVSGTARQSYLDWISISRAKAPSQIASRRNAIFERKSSKRTTASCRLSLARMRAMPVAQAPCGIAR